MFDKNINSKINTIIVISMLILSFCAFSTFTLKNLNNFTQENLSDSSSLDSQERKGYPSDLLQQSTENSPKFPSSGFIRNQGQITDDSIKYYYSTNGFIVGFSSTEVKFGLMSIQSPIPNYFAISFPNAQEVSPVGVFQKRHYVNCFYKQIQQINIPTYGEVWYYNLYTGIDLRYYISNEGLKYEFIVHPGVDPSPIRLKVSPTMKLSIEDRQVSYRSSLFEELILQDTNLRVFQSDGLEIDTKFVLKGSEQDSYGFHIDSFNPDQFLTIDPLILTFSTYLGGNNYEYGNDILVDSYNNTYITGKTSSMNFPTTPNSLNDTNNGGGFDIFISKLDSTGNGLVYSTYIGGNGDDSALGLAVDMYNNTYITGQTSSSNFPLSANAINDTYNGGSYDLFITKINSTGNKIEFSTYLGGTGEDVGKSCVVDQFNNTYITGNTASSNFPADNGYSSFSGGYDAFITKINAAGDTVIFSSLIGGNMNDYSNEIAIDTYNNSYVTGETWSDNYPIKNEYSSSKWGNVDAFITKLNASGNGLVFSTFIGGSAEDYGLSIAVDSYNNTYITGKTISANFPIYKSYNAHSGGFDAFITKMNASGSGLVYSTYLGGNWDDFGLGITVDDYNNTYITGKTASSSFPVTMNAFNRTFGGSYDAFITKLNTTGNGLLYSSFIGGSGEDSGEAIAIDSYNNTYIAGFTRSSDFPTNNFYNSSFSGFVDVFVTKFTLDDILPEITLVSPQNNTVLPSGTLVDLTVTDNHLTKVLINWDEQPNQTLTTTYLITTPSGDGEHLLHVYANDEAGNWATKVYTFITDDTPPEIALISPKNRTYPSILVDIFGKAAHYWYSIEGVDGTNNTWTNVEPRTLTNGTYTLHAYANDSIGNLAYKSVIFTIDTSFAAVDINSPFNKTYTDSNISIDLSGNAEHYWYYLENIDQVNQSWNPDEYRDFEDGTYILHVYGNNTAGNVTFISITFSIDTTPPALSIISPQNKTITSETILIDFSGDAEYYWYQIDGVDGGNLSWNSPIFRTLANDIYTVHVYGNDSNGNEAYKNVTFTVNTTLATVIIDSPMSSMYSTDNITISFSGDANLYWYSIEGVDTSNLMWTVAVIRNLDDGTYTLHAYGSKIYGVDTYVNVTFTIDTTPPIVTIDTPSSSTIREGTFNVSLSGEAINYWYYIAGVDQVNLTWKSSIERTLSDGEYTLHAYGNDSAGNVGFKSVIFTIDTTPINTTIEPTTTTSQETTIDSSSTTAKSGSFASFYTIVLFNILFVIISRRRKKK
ncbi:MAG: SBBP repeat-containing protein [Candidatus Hodarchaeales archaeon]